MKRIGLRTYFILSSILFAILFAAVSTGLWRASDELERTAFTMHNSLASITVSESMLDLLERHRRQALLRSIRTDRERKQNRDSIAAELQHSLKSVEMYIDSPEEREITTRATQAIRNYLETTDKLLEVGASGPRLYLGTSSTFDQAVGEISALIHVNQVQALDEEKKAIGAGTNYKNLALSLIAGIVLILTLVLIMFHHLIYLPVKSLRFAIDNFSRTKSVAATTARGLTELHEITTAFNDLVQSLQHQNEQRFVFLSSVAHDIKNPLSAIQMSLDLLTSDPGSAKSGELSALLRRQVQRLRSLVDDLLDSSRIEAGHLELERSRQDVCALVRDAVQLFEPLTPTHQFGLSLPKEKIDLYCDGGRLSQVLNNILSNAIKYSPQGGEVKVAVYRAGDFAIITVSDQGIGIDPENLKVMFEPFRRPNTGGHQIPGVGLGLSTSKKIVEAHNGWIQVQSKTGKGTVFLITLPLGDMIPKSPRPNPTMQ